MSKRKNISRRKFLSQASCAAIGSTTLFSSLMSLNTINALAAQSNIVDGDYKALVCILLSGGCDSFNVLVPRGNEYTDYATTRGNVALPLNDLLAVNPLFSKGREFGLHPSLTNVQSLFENGKAAFITNVGTLVHPIKNVDDYKNSKYKVPKGLYSHSDQVQQWQTSVPNDRKIVNGWAGRMADIMHTLNGNQNISMNISLSGRNVFQAGNSIIEYAIKSSGIEGVIGLEGGRQGVLNRIRDNAINDLLSLEYRNVFESTYANMNQTSIGAYNDFSNAINKLDPFNTGFSDNSLSDKMKMIAKVIATRNDLSMKRQTFFVDYGGWDHHSNLLSGQQDKLNTVDTAVAEFYNVLEEMGIQNKVTLFTISDFARSMTSNDTGTDHAWGGNSLVVGGAVNGKRIYGNYPSIYLKNNPLLTSGRGTVIPQISTDEYFAELALWFGVSPGNLTDVLPNIGNFYTYNPSQLPLGFMQQ